MENNQETEQQNYEFTNAEREQILQAKFKVGEDQNECEDKSIEEIIDGIINAIKNYDDIYKDCILQYWFTKQIEEWKKKNNKEPSNDELMEMVREDLKVRIANTMLELKQELKKHKDIKEEDIWFYCSDDNNYVILQHNNDYICEVSDFNHFHQRISPPYKPFFMKNTNDNNKLNGVCIYKHGDDKKKTKWIMACFKDDGIVPQCKITFKTNKNDKIKNVEIETAKDENSELTYTIFLNDEGRVEKITKNGKEVNNADCIEEINNLLFKDDMFKVLRERIEDEFDSQQKAVFDNIKAHLGDVKEEKKDEEKKGEEKKEEEKKEEEKKEENKEEEKVNINNKPADTNINNVPKCFGSYRKNGKDVYRCFGVDIC